MKYSFLVCAYNAQNYLKECIESLKKQTYKEKYEIVIVNDGSTDKTEEIAKSFKGVKVVNQTNKGLPWARNTAIENSIGEWLIYVDSDDYVSENYLEEIENIVSKNKEINFVKLWEKKGKKTEKKDKKVQSNKIDDSVVSRAIRRDVVEGYKFPYKYKFAIEDWDFYVHNLHKLSIADLSQRKDVYYFYRYTHGSLSKTNNIYKSRFEHALSIFENPKLRKQNFDQEIIGHYWEHLYMVAKLWHKELMPRVKACRYKTKIRLGIRIQYWVVKLCFLNWLIKKVGKPIKE